MRFEVLSSGSKGNTTYIETNSTKIIIDMGNSCKYVVEKLNLLGIDPNDIDAIMLTHIHTDHTNGLKTFLKKYNIKVYLASSMLNYLPFISNYFVIDDSIDSLVIGDVNIDVIRTSHDVEDSFGYVVNNLDKSVVYITDTGYINQRYFDLLKNRNAYVFESNHDVEMLTNGRYPFELRQRILSDKGHLSNYDSAKYLASFIGGNTKYIILAHLSEENNTVSLAHNTLITRLDKSKIDYSDIKIVEALQNKETDFIEL